MGLPMLVRARGTGSRRRPYQRSNALVWMQARNAEAATSAGLSRRIKGKATVTLFEDTEGGSQSEVSPLTGLRLRLEGKYASKCCKNIAIVHPGKGSHAAELRCADCSRHCGWLPRAAANWLLDVLAFWPNAKQETHILTNVKDSDPRGSGLW